MRGGAAVMTAAGTDGTATESTSVLDRSLAMLDAVAQSQETLSLSELARRLGMPKSTAHRHVAQLVARGLLERDDEGLRLGMALFELGHRVPAQRALREAASGALTRLQAAAGGTAHLVVPARADVLYLEKISGVDAVGLPSRVGGRMPAHATAVGKMLLAHLPPESVDAVLRGRLRRVTLRTTVAPGVLRRQLVAARERGIAVEREEAVAGVSCVAAAVRGETGAVVAAISLARVSGSPDWEARAALLLRTAAAEISERLGAPPGSTPDMSGRPLLRPVGPA
ncbi:IclR family transcriptional regulator [Pseudonocardia sp. WMMC193]|uniref:IclR family transcriptional regulator n=1 Tax=Pseudonocardia sp. WMMC193 TaxID=2911965 RepID=UPI001F26DD4F|nr:IclR family transcriptional regulator [Pseudonocardia sp. WMMC193]MCF7550868.1 IclR family transcriptional regulator [Pseudonocardia sp. WMMC193]